MGTKWRVIPELVRDLHLHTSKIQMLFGKLIRRNGLLRQTVALNMSNFLHSYRIKTRSRWRPGASNRRDMLRSSQHFMGKKEFQWKITCLRVLDLPQLRSSV